MVNYARIEAGVVVEVVEITTPPLLADRFHPAVVATFFAVPEPLAGQVAPGWLFDDEDFSPPAPVVESPAPLPAITARQLRLWLIDHGYRLADVDAVIDSMPEEDREAARVEWEYSTAYERAHPLIESIGVALGFTDDEISAGFVAAAML